VIVGGFRMVREDGEESKKDVIRVVSEEGSSEDLLLLDPEK
jgi:hypothetical protein